MVARYRPRLEALDSNIYYDAKYLARRWSVHPVTIWKWVGTGHLPAPTKLGQNCSRWLGSAILEFEKQRRELQDAA